MSNAARAGTPNTAAALGWRRDAAAAECQRISTRDTSVDGDEGDSDLLQYGVLPRMGEVGAYLCVHG
jgi:hypothetical protein